mmetsp:Transcript_12663/g.37962  ORF Transcript_12663/g.37962 Transcript_12663/m.37962 type:complete len:147 (-) Transcript_12663:102-542(-)
MRTLSVVLALAAVLLGLSGARALSWAGPTRARVAMRLQAGASRRSAVRQQVAVLAGLALAAPLSPVLAADLPDLDASDASEVSASDEEQLRIQRKLEAQRAASKNSVNPSYKESFKQEQQKRAERSSRTKKEKQQDLCEPAPFPRS